MAETNKHRVIREQKKQLANQINSINEQLLAQANKVPKSVLNGSHQVAVAWKEKAESVFSGQLSGVPSRASVPFLQERLTKKNVLLSQVMGIGL